jgi:kinesin family protein 18/19
VLHCRYLDLREDRDDSDDADGDSDDGDDDDAGDGGGDDADDARARYLDLREDPLKGPIVAGLTEIEATSAEEVMDLLQRGNARRSQHPTAANEVSSRSHAVLQLSVEIRRAGGGGGGGGDAAGGGAGAAGGAAVSLQRAKLFIVDLAGSEKMSPGDQSAASKAHVAEVPTTF